MSLTVSWTQRIRGLVRRAELTPQTEQTAELHNPAADALRKVRCSDGAGASTCRK